MGAPLRIADMLIRFFQSKKQASPPIQPIGLLAMQFRYRLPGPWISKAAEMVEFANGGAQVTIRLKDGREMPEVLISNSTHIVAMRGQKELPFAVEDISDIFQSVSDRGPRKREGWYFWDEWTS